MRFLINLTPTGWAWTATLATLAACTLAFAAGHFTMATSAFVLTILCGGIMLLLTWMAHFTGGRGTKGMALATLTALAATLFFTL